MWYALLLSSDQALLDRAHCARALIDVSAHHKNRLVVCQKVFAAQSSLSYAVEQGLAEAPGGNSKRHQ